VRAYFTPLRLACALVGLVLAAAIVLYLVPSNDYLLLPDTAHPVAPLVEVKGGHDPRGPGGIYFVDVFERRASMFESLFPWIHDGATLVPAKLIVPPGVSDNALRQADLREMSISQRVAAAVALKRLGYRRWKRLHRLAYVAPVLGVIHFTWRVKKDVSEPTLYAIVLGTLLLIRVVTYARSRLLASVAT